MVIHFARLPQPDDRAHNGPALCGAGSLYRSPAHPIDTPTRFEQLVIGVWDGVTCLNCRRMLDAYNKREAREELRAEQHREADPHCTCPDCIVHHAAQMESETTP